jgi:hypothetical protein
MSDTGYIPDIELVTCDVDCTAMTFAACHDRCPWLLEYPPAGYSVVDGRLVED